MFVIYGVGSFAFTPPIHKQSDTQCVVDAITKIGSLYYKGEITPCTYDECKNLEIVAVWDRHHLVDRLMGDDTWLNTLRRPTNPNKKS